MWSVVVGRFGYGDGGVERKALGFFSREVWCLKNRAVWLCERDDVVWMLCFTFFGRVVCGVVGWGGGVIG